MKPVRFCCVLLLVPFLVSCSQFTLRQHDPMTVEQIQQTIEHEERTQAFVEGKLSAEAELEFDVVSDAEIARLKAWKAAEDAKKINDPPEE